LIGLALGSFVDLQNRLFVWVPKAVDLLAVTFKLHLGHELPDLLINGGEIEIAIRAGEEGLGKISMILWKTFSGSGGITNITMISPSNMGIIEIKACRGK